MHVLTVSQLNRYVKAVLEEDRKLSDLYLKGEISNFTCHYKSGHFYFSLRDAQSSVKAVMFKSDARQVRFEPENGMSVILRASVSLYERDGSYQIYVTDLQPDGAGALSVAFEQRKAKLAALGYFEESHKRPLPPYPRRIGVVTSETGAALQDIIQVLSRRYPLGTLVLCPSPVQGAEAAKSLARAVRSLDGNCDVMIVGRGGGSAEDLWCFNEEVLAHAVFQAQTPVISAVGHETDYTICDFVADTRAPTPSAAAELVAPSAEAMGRALRDRREFLERQAHLLLARKRERLQAAAKSRALCSPLHTVEKKRERLDFLYDSLYNNSVAVLDRLGRRVSHQAALLDTLSPLRVLERGYAAVLNQGGRAVQAAMLSPGDGVRIRFSDGEASARVQEVQTTCGDDGSEGGRGRNEEKYDL